MPGGAAAAGYGESSGTPVFLNESRGGDENCTAGDDLVRAWLRRWNRQI